MGGEYTVLVAASPTAKPTYPRLARGLAARDMSMNSPLAPARPGGGWSIDNSGYDIANSKTYLPRLARGLAVRDASAPTPPAHRTHARKGADFASYYS